MKHFTTCISVMFVAGLLSGCGAGSGIKNSGGGGESFDSGAAIRLTGSTAPKETLSDQLARVAALRTRSDDSVGAIYGETNIPEAPTFNGTCRGPNCRVNVSGETISISLVDLDNIEARTDSSTAVLTRNDITLFEARGGTGGENYRLYGAWMDHAAFGVETNIQLEEVGGIELSARGASAGGDITGSQPSVDAKWRGVMVGTPARGNLRDNILQGDAELTYRASDAEIDARFSNITDLDRQAPHSASEVRFDDIPVAYDGTYTAGKVGNRIMGGFAGPDHAESAGIFEQQGIIGAFGAKRQK